MNPVALITGGSRGIGRGIALELSAIGYDLVINFAANGKAAAETAHDCEARGKAAFQLEAAGNGDIADRQRAAACVGQTERSQDRLSALAD